MHRSIIIVLIYFVLVGIIHAKSKNGDAENTIRAWAKHHHEDAGEDNDDDDHYDRDAGGLRMKETKRNEVRTDMFEMHAKDKPDQIVSFGFRKIVELDADGETIGADKHICDFKNDNVTCTLSEDQLGSIDALDDDGFPTLANYTMKSYTCLLSECNHADARLVVRSYIMLNKAYLCQPNCSASNETVDVLQTPVYNGTAKWDVEITDWDFCSQGSEHCSSKVAEKLKIYFKVGGSKNGKEQKIRKKTRVPLTEKSDRFEVRCGQDSEKKYRDKYSDRFDKDRDSDKNSSEEDRDSDKNSVEEYGESDESKVDDEDNDVHKDDGAEEEMGGSDGASAQKIGSLNDMADIDRDEIDKEHYDYLRREPPRKMRPRCKPARTTSFHGIPEDQVAFSYGDSDSDSHSDTGEEADSSSVSPTVRFFDLAVLDDSLVITNETGFDGPDIEELEEVEEVGLEKTVKLETYISISVVRFEKKMVYDPTADMSEYGGTQEESQDVQESFGMAVSVGVTLLSTAIAAVLLI